jgi:peptidoglycan/xylan/chitin deacetylase (PgdA/CDA1 family)
VRPGQLRCPGKNLPMRIDRQLTTAVFHPLQRAGIAASGLRLPILMFHSVSDDPENGSAPYFKTNTAPNVFRRHMNQLAAEGYKTLDLVEAVGFLFAGRQWPEKSVAITFDDGYRDFHTHAFPALREHGFTATVFLPTAFISNQRRQFKNTDCLTWDEVRELRAAGIGFGSHTVNHLKLLELSFPQIETELVESKQQMEQELGEPVRTFAFPYAFPQANREFVQEFRELLMRARYACCVTTELGRVKIGDDPYLLKRLPVNSLDDEDLLRAKLEGGYDWLAVPQSLAKKVKALRGFPKKNESAGAPPGPGA